MSCTRARTPTFASTKPSWFLSMSLKLLRLKSSDLMICSQVLPDEALSEGCVWREAGKGGGWAGAAAVSRSSAGKPRAVLLQGRLAPEAPRRQRGFSSSGWWQAQSGGIQPWKWCHLTVRPLSCTQQSTLCTVS